jgi:carbonic anhydrase
MTMLSKSALAAAVAGGVTTAVVIAMASGLSPKNATAHGADHGEDAEMSALHDPEPGHGEPGNGTGTKDSGHDAANHADPHADPHSPSVHADPQDGGHAAHAGPETPTKPASKPAPAKHDTPAPGRADPHADPQNDPHGDPHIDPHAGPADPKPAGRADPHAEAGSMSAADTALKMLQEGNDRWVAGQSTHPNTDAARRKELADAGQKPFVTVLTCADSRVPVERVVDRGVGEVFVVRVAGAIAGVSETGTVEYGLGHLHTPLLVVMGHTKCGAVAAAASGANVGGRIKDIVEAIEPAVERARRKNPGAEGADLAAAAVKENVWQTVFGLMRESKESRTLVGQGKVKVVGAVCDISTGKVEWLGEHPWQQELIDALGGMATAEKDEGHK